MHIVNVDYNSRHNQTVHHVLNEMAVFLFILCMGVTTLNFPVSHNTLTLPSDDATITVLFVSLYIIFMAEIH